MAIGDWPSGAYIMAGRGYLNGLPAGLVNEVDVDYEVVLPSGARVLNGGVTGFTPFHYVANATLSLTAGMMATVAALAAAEGLDVHMTIGVMHPNGSFTPNP